MKLKKLFAIVAVGAVCVGAFSGAPARATDSPEDVLALVTDANASLKRGMESLNEAEMHWRLGNTTQTCDALAQAHTAFLQGYRDEQQVKADLESGDILSGDDARQVREWVDGYEETIPPISEKMKRLGGDSNC